MNQHGIKPGGARGPAWQTPPGRREPRLPDLRPSSPGQLALIGLGLWLAGIFLPGLGILTAAGLVALVIAGASLFIRPRAREMYWRGRRIDVGGAPTLGERLYRALYRRA